jgi:phenylalanyl-tRNA synthetase alpha chain
VVDVTLPVREPPEARGRIHPISQVIDELTAIFADMGFSVAEGPDIETDYSTSPRSTSPSAIPPARCTTPSSCSPTRRASARCCARTPRPVQIRTMTAQKPPIRVIIPGRTYRHDSDQTHTPMFHQVEGLVIDKAANIANMKWVLEEFCKAFFEVDSVKMRFRPSFFPFTEPSAEVDIQCSRKGGEIRFGEGTDWLEILGCGMVHPNVLRNCGLDPDEYQGFAWGMGIDRIAMLKYGMPDLRPFFDADVRWLQHYGFRPLDLPTLLRVCMVDAGAGEPVQVVCGAPNARTGMKSVFAPPGTYIPGKNITLGKGVIRGVESAACCAPAFELELSDDHDGIIDLPEDAPVGMRYAIMPARRSGHRDQPDAEPAGRTGVHGIARDLAAAGIGAEDAAVKPVDPANSPARSVKLDFATGRPSICAPLSRCASCAA